MPELFPVETIGSARIAVERGLDRYPEGLTYSIPPDLDGLAVGERVIVPLGRGDRPTPGYVIEVSADLAPPGPGRRAIKSIARRDHGGTRLPGGLVELARWISGYYCAPIGMTLTAVLPAAVKRNTGAVVRTLVDLAPDAPETSPRSPKQRAALEILRALPAAERPVELRDLADRAGSRTTGPIKRLLEGGYLVAVHKSAVEARWAAHGRDATVPARLTEDQTKVIDAIAATLDGGYSAHLLHGVTGAGKTEVYIRLVERVVAAGRVAVVLVPEIALTPQTGGRLLGRFPGHRVAIMHSGLTAAQRHQHWSMIADGTADIVLGARSGVFAPVPDGRLGLIVVDEEHDGSYKQDQIPRYHGRDVAMRRAQLAACPVLLGSATPAAESWWNATERRAITLHRLPTRAPGLTLPVVRVVDVLEERRHAPNPRALIGPTLAGALTRTLDRGGQALLMLNRRGFATFISCPDPACGWVLNCDHCDVTMVHHRHRRLPTGGFVRCHHCLAEQRLPQACPQCGRPPRSLGLGTQGVEEELAGLHHSLETGRTLVRVDSDAMRSARDFHDVLERFGRGDIRVMVGTQMIAKGLDFPGVTLVGVINADTAINLPDFRAAERTFQLVSQVAGRCGRGSSGENLVIVQSMHPETPAIRLAAQHDYLSFIRLELEARRAAQLPPARRMARIVVRDVDHDRAAAGAEAVAGGLRGLPRTEKVEIRGPAPCPIARIAERFRFQVEVLADEARTVQTLLAAARNAELLRPGASMVVDVDPVALL